MAPHPSTFLNQTLTTSIWKSSSLCRKKPSQSLPDPVQSKVGQSALMEKLRQDNEWFTDTQPSYTQGSAGVAGPLTGVKAAAREGNQGSCDQEMDR